MDYIGLTKVQTLISDTHASQASENVYNKAIYVRYSLDAN